MRIEHERLKALVASLFEAAGCSSAESERIAHYLVAANLVGHDSHGVIRVPQYLAWLREGKVVANERPEILFENGPIAVLDGRFGFGQVMGEAALRLAIERCAQHGLAVVALRNSGHLGRIGDWAEMAADAGKVSLHFVNTSGGGILVAPHGGTERRLSANPVAAGVPVAGRPPLILDISTCTIAEGKIKVAFNKGSKVPERCILDGQGHPTVDPKAFYASPPGAILPLAGHKGFGLSVIVEVLAGALTGGHCSRPGETRVANNMLTILLDPSAFPVSDRFQQEIEDLITFVKSAATVERGGEILMPGEPEHRTRIERLRDGIELDETTWGQVVAAGRDLGLSETATA